MRKSDVVLINPPLNPEAEINTKIKAAGNAGCPFLGLAYVAAVLEKAGFSVQIIDANVLRLNVDEIAESVRFSECKIVGFTSTTPTINSVLQIVKAIKALSPQIKTVLGGVHVSAIPVETMTACPELDFGVIGEGEITTVELSRKIFNGDDSFKGLAGIVFRDKATNELVRTETRPLIENLNDIPFPARHLLPMELYRPSLVSYRRYPQTSVVCSRGCPYDCIFCTKHVFGKRMRFRDVDNVIEELKSLKKDYNVREIDFYDETLTLNKKWLGELCEKIAPLKLIWQCNGRVEGADPARLKEMKRAGCYKINYGVESGNQKSLDILKKNITLEQIRYAFDVTHKAGISTLAFMMMGIPGEDLQDIKTSIDFCIRLKTEDAVFTLLTPYPGNEIYRELGKYGVLEVKDWSKYICIPNQPVFVPFSISKDELTLALNLAYRSFVFRPQYIAHRLKDCLINPSKFIAYFKGAFNLLK
jgi:anaerobic magnesium-protoporphyrin IX monomethyl ester cyclase